jgi:serine/threonine protein kinase
VKLMDFGIAKAIRSGDEEGDAETTRAGTVVGTPAYMSPEQVLGQQTIDARADLWSLGAMIYRMVVGLAPFGQGGFGEIGVRILAVEPTAPSIVIPKLPKAFDEFMKKALAKDPAERFQTTTELSTALAKVAEIRSRELDTTTMRALKTATTLSPTMPSPFPAPPVPMPDRPTTTSSRNASGVRRVQGTIPGAVWLALGVLVIGVLALLAPAARGAHGTLASSTGVRFVIVPVVPRFVVATVTVASSSSSPASSAPATRNPPLKAGVVSPP